MSALFTDLKEMVQQNKTKKGMGESTDKIYRNDADALGHHYKQIKQR